MSAWWELPPLDDGGTCAADARSQKIAALFSLDTLRRGVDCPCCGRYLKINRKRLNRTMMQYLLQLYRARNSEDGWFHASRFQIHAGVDPASDLEQYGRAQTGDYKTLRHWGLVELHSTRRGFARITDRGINFVEGRVRVPEAVLLENWKNCFVAFVGDDVTAQQAAQTSFKLAEL